MQHAEDTNENTQIPCLGGDGTLQALVPQLSVLRQGKRDVPGGGGESGPCCTGVWDREPRASLSLPPPCCHGPAFLGVQGARPRLQNQSKCLLLSGLHITH